MPSPAKSSAELEREVEDQRHQLETRVEEIQRRLSPGQLVDELLDYARGSGGGDFIANLGRSVQANPLPLALTGVGLAWLMTRSAMPAPLPAATGWDDGVAQRNTSTSLASSSRSLASIAGSTMQRVGDTTDEAGQRYTEFTDEAGARFRALTDEMNARAGHFTDAAGNSYRGFITTAGDRVRDFLDESGNRLANAESWAGDSWASAGEGLDSARHAVGDARDALGANAQQVGRQLTDGATSTGRMVKQMLQEQPLVGAAVAFTLGAAVAALLPPTAQEDALLGEAADDVKEEGARAAREAYDEGKSKVADAYDAVREKAAAAYERVQPQAADDASGMSH